MSSKDNLTKTGEAQTRLYEAARWTKAIGIGELSADERELFEFWLDDPKRPRTLSECRATLVSLRKLPPETAARLREKMMGNATGAVGGRRSSSTIVTPPGDMLAQVAKFLLTPNAYKKYVEPVIADMQQEYIDAIAARHTWHARYIVLRGHLLVIPGWIYALVVGNLAALLRQGR
jgi:hypothetical protein